MNTTLTRSFIKCAELYNAFAHKRLTKNVKKETFGIGSYANIGLEETEDFVPTKFTMVQCDLFDNLSPRATKLVIKIIKELKENNALWKFEHAENQSEKKALAELRKKDILHKTENPLIHIVNPLYLRRGTPAGVAYKTMDLLKDVTRVTEDHIISLRSRSPKGDVVPPDLLDMGLEN